MAYEKTAMSRKGFLGMFADFGLGDFLHRKSKTNPGFDQESLREFLGGEENREDGRLRNHWGEFQVVRRDDHVLLRAAGVLLASHWCASIYERELSEGYSVPLIVSFYELLLTQALESGIVTRDELTAIVTGVSLLTATGKSSDPSVELGLTALSQVAGGGATALLYGQLMVEERKLFPFPQPPRHRG